MTEEQDNLEKFVFHLSNRLPVLSCEYERVWRIGRAIIQCEKVGTYGGCAEKLYVADNIFRQ